MSFVEQRFVVQQIQLARRTRLEQIDDSFGALRQVQPERPVRRIGRGSCDRITTGHRRHRQAAHSQSTGGKKFTAQQRRPVRMEG